VQRYQLTEATVLRPEAFGGIAFQTRRGITVELDTEAYRLLCSFHTPRMFPEFQSDGHALASELRRLGFLQPVSAEATSTPLPSADLPPDTTLSPLAAPEIVHVALTARCDLICPGCYAFLGRQMLSWPVVRQLIDQLAQMRVFQLALGGGEPTLYPHLVDVVAYARQQKMVANITTHGGHLTPALVASLRKAGVGQINISLNASAPEHNTGRGERPWQSAMNGLEQLRHSGITTGVNCLVTAPSLAYLPELLSMLVDKQIRNVTILGPKPANDPHWLLQHQLTDEDYLQLQAILHQWHAELNITVDCALVGRIMGDLPTDTLRSAGIYGCMAAQRMCVIDADGNVWPCAFQKSAHFCGGNILNSPFRDIWLYGPGFQRFRRTHCGGGTPCYECECPQPEAGLSS
jgi:radical SAM protein with 4Fe4S-binding SPASM domain